MPDLWDELGIPHTSDAAAIRRAYAARLKAVRPDADPQGFAQLRAAYEQALAAAAAPPPPDPAPVPPAAAPGAPAAAAAASPGPVRADPAPAPVPPPAADPMAPFLGRGDVPDAADWLLRARAAGSLTLAADLQLADRLGWAMAQDRALPAPAVREAAERLGWPEGASSAMWAGALRARLDAERWLESLRRASLSRTRWLGHVVPIVARMMLGRGRLRLSLLMAGDPRLRQRYGEYVLHAPLVADRFDPARIEAIGRLVTHRPNRQVERVFETFGRLVVAGIAGALVGQAAAALDPRLQDGVTGAVAVIVALTSFVPAVRRRLDRMLWRYGRR